MYIHFSERSPPIKIKSCEFHIFLVSPDAVVNFPNKNVRKKNVNGNENLPYKFFAMWTECWLSQKCGHKFVSIHLNKKKRLLALQKYKDKDK